MSEQPPKPDADRSRRSIKEAIGKITGDRRAIREGAAGKAAASLETTKAS